MTALSHIKLALAAAALAAAPVTFAHGSMKPKHGGIVTMSGETVVELVRGAQGVSVYVTEEDEPLPAASMTAKLTVTADSGGTETPLTAGPDNRFDAPGLQIPTGAKVAVVLVNKATHARTLAAFTIK